MSTFKVLLDGQHGSIDVDADNYTTTATDVTFKRGESTVAWLPVFRVVAVAWIED